MVLSLRVWLPEIHSSNHSTLSHSLKKSNIVELGTSTSAAIACIVRDLYAFSAALSQSLSSSPDDQCWSDTSLEGHYPKGSKCWASWTKVLPWPSSERLQPRWGIRSFDKSYIRTLLHSDCRFLQFHQINFLLGINRLRWVAGYCILRS